MKVRAFIFESGRCVMTVAEAAKKIGISTSKIYQLAAARRISHYRVGGKPIFSDDDVAAFLASCRVGVATPAATTHRSTIKLKHLHLA